LAFATPFGGFAGEEHDKTAQIARRSLKISSSTDDNEESRAYATSDI
jgi:hypothetical protein